MTNHGEHSGETRGRRKAATSITERFWSKVQMRGADECWLWLGRFSRYGYGMFTTDRRNTTTASRVAFQLTHPSIRLTRSDYVCHSCDNPACVNPKHLWLGDAGSNYHDSRSKGRARVGHAGEGSARAKLTAAQVAEIRRRRSLGERPGRIAKEFGIAPCTVVNIAAGRFWRSPSEAA